MEEATLLTHRSNSMELMVGAEEGGLIMAFLVV